MNDFKWQIYEVVMEFKKKISLAFWQWEARKERLNSDKIIGMREEQNLEAF